MSLKEYIDFANEEKVCYLATSDNGRPRVRGFLLWFADEKGFYFHTGSTKQVCKQLQKDPNVEVCFNRTGNEPGTSKMMRVAGEVAFVEDEPLKARLLEERPFLKGIGENVQLKIFRIFKGEAHFWTLENNLKESEIKKITF